MRGGHLGGCSCTGRPSSSEEAEGCFDALEIADVVELVQVKQDGHWRGVKIEGKRRPAGYPLDRGDISPARRARRVAPGGNYYKEGKAIPLPLELVRFAGDGAWEEHLRAVLGLTRMNWNNDSLYDRLPVTLGYALVLARTVMGCPGWRVTATTKAPETEGFTAERVTARGRVPALMFPSVFPRARGELDAVRARARSPK